MLKLIANLLFEIVRVMSEPAQLRRCRISDGTIRVDRGVQCVFELPQSRTGQERSSDAAQGRRIRRMPSEVALDLFPHG